MPLEETLEKARAKIKRLRTVKMKNGPVNLNASIRMMHGKEAIADNRKSFEDMAARYKKWLLR
jgi:nickel-dependent lactate racemase